METSSSKEESPLQDVELWWHDNYAWLKENGYVLRPRYAPGWEPSWKDKKGHVFQGNYEDGVSPIRLNVLDAVKPDGTRVCLKRIPQTDHTLEASLLELLSSPPLSDDPHNHCVPLEKAFSTPDNQYTILVMPVLRHWESPPLQTVGEVIDLISQIFQGVLFMHQNGFAHRDIKWNNIMMDGSKLFPDGFHFVAQDKTPDFKGRARYFSRTEKPPKYYLIDLGHSKRYDISNGPPSDLPLRGGDKTVPEHQPDKKNQPCNPFKVDVYSTGNILRWYLTEGYRDGPHVLYHAKGGFDFLKPLVADMVQEDPDKRPSMEEVVARFDKIRESLSAWKLRSRLMEKREWLILSFARNIPHWGRTVRYVARRLSATPVTSG